MREYFTSWNETFSPHFIDIRAIINSEHINWAINSEHINYDTDIKLPILQYHVINIICHMRCHKFISTLYWYQLSLIFPVVSYQQIPPL